MKSIASENVKKRKRHGRPGSYRCRLEPHLNKSEHYIVMGMSRGPAGFVGNQMVNTLALSDHDVLATLASGNIMKC